MSKVKIREAVEADVPQVRNLFERVYGGDYPFKRFLDDWWLKWSVFGDDVLMLVAASDDRVLGTASVVFDVGAHSDLLGEFGRLVVDPAARGHGVGHALMNGRVRACRDRIHVGVVENRCVHPYSQKISLRHGFAPVGFLPMKHLFSKRESVALWAQLFGGAASLRRNHPRVVPEVHGLADLSLMALGLPADAIIDDVAPPYPRHPDYDVQVLTERGLPSLARIERGRVSRRAVFGPMSLHYGFFKVRTRQGSYLVARRAGGSDVAGAIGFVHDEIDRGIKVFELIHREDEVVRILLERLLEQAGEWDCAYIEIDVSAHAPRMQRTLLELGFLPGAYIPAMVFHQVERLDVVRMVNLLVPLELGDLELLPTSREVYDTVIAPFVKRQVLPRVQEAIHRMGLFRGLSDEQAQRVARVCTLADLPDGELLYRQGEQADALYMLIHGAVNVSIDDRTVGQVRAGEPVGEVSVLTGEPRSATVRAARTVTAAVLDRPALEALMRQRPDIGVILCRNLAVGLGRKLQRVDAALLSG